MQTTTSIGKIRGTWDTTRKQVETKIGALEEKARHTIVDLEKMAKGSAMNAMGEVPEQLRGAWHGVLDKLREGLDVATREDISRLGARVDELAKKVDKLARASVAKARETTTRKGPARK